MERWRRRDPLDVTRSRLAAEYAIGQDKLDAIDADVEREIERITAAGVHAPFPESNANASEFATPIPP